MPIAPRSESSRRAAVAALSMLLAALLAACGPAFKVPELDRLYNEAAQNIGDERNPVVVIPGILGTRLIDPETGGTVWGAFTRTTVNPASDNGARTVALPLAEGVPLDQLTDGVATDGVLDRLELDLLLLRGLRLSAYVDILATLAAGEYRDSELGDAGVIDYGGAHYTCFQFPYDWRREISEHAPALHEMILSAKRANPRHADRGDDLKVDVVAHSMGGLVLRYYLRYGPHPIGPDGEIPPLTWEGARHVENAILVATPNAGSVSALEQLVEGVRFAPFTAKYRAPLLGTFPSIYQLLPRTRHARVVDAASGEPIDLFDPATWEDRGWGLAGERDAETLARLIPDAEDDAARRRIARDHLAKSLRAARAFHEAIDRPAAPPAGLRLHLFTGDAEPTASILRSDARSGRLRTALKAPGDGTVTRRSALMDERVGTTYAPFLRSPIAWDRAFFLPKDHLGLTRDPSFTNNLLFILLERPSAVGPSGPPNTDR